LLRRTIKSLRLMSNLAKLRVFPAGSLPPHADRDVGYQLNIPCAYLEPAADV
jgi:hypothetical protein